MSNKASDSLHRLIKSLTKPEKRYFKVFSSRHVIGDQNNYLVLFDAIDRQSEYDEAKLLKKFKNEPFVKRFSIAKSRLYNAILKSLDAYHANSSVEAQLKRQLHCAEILYNKSLYAQSQKLLNSARKTAIKHEKITTLIEIRKWEKRLMEKDNYEGISPESIEQIREDDGLLNRKLERFNELWYMKSRMFQHLYVKGKSRSAEEQERFGKILEEFVLEIPEEEMMAENRYLLNHLNSAYYYGIGSYAECYPHLRRNLKLIEQQPHLFREEPNIYLSVLTNAIFVASQLGKTDEALEMLERMKSLPSELEPVMTQDREIRMFSFIKSTELSLYTAAQDFEAAGAVVTEIEEGLIRFDKKLSSVRKAFFYFNISVLYFYQEHYNESLKWTNMLLNNIDIDKTQDIHCMAQLLNLIVHLELGNKSLLQYTIRSTKRYLETRNKVYRFETIFLEFVNDLLRKRKSFTDAERYGELAKALRPLRDDAFEKHAFEYFDFLTWAEGAAARLNTQRA